MATKHYSHKQIRKSIKKDELKDLLDHLLTFGKKHTENILISGIIIAVAVVLIPLYFNNREQNEERANGLLNRAINLSMQPLAEGLADPNSGQFRTLGEKYKKVQEAYAEINGAYRNTLVARIGLVGEADADFYLKEYDKALALYQEAKQKETDPQLRLTLDQKIAACYENQGKWQEALNGYQALLASKPPYFNVQAVRIAVGRCFANLGQNDKAVAIWKQAGEDKAGGYWVDMAKTEIQLLEKSQK